MNYENLITNSKALLNGEFNYNATDHGLTKVFETWEERKSGLLDLMRKHPNWDEDTLSITISANFTRDIDKDVCSEFYNWVCSQLRKKWKEEYEVKRKCFTYAEARNIVRTLQDRIDALCVDVIRDNPRIIKIKDELVDEQIRFQDLLHDMRADIEHGIESMPDDKGGTIYVPYYKYQDFYTITDIISLITSSPSQFISEDRAEILNSKLESVHDKLNLEAKVGQKTSRFVGSLCKKLGLSKIKTMVTRSYTDSNGDTHEREVDEGYNKQYAAFCDAINPLEVPEEIIISLNPLDFWTMSLGNGWSSCYTIDKENIRGVAHGNGYSGAYSAGTTSYMLDSSTFIVYTKGDEERYGKYTKKRRCVFAWGEDKLFQSRVYPDGRDGGSNTIADQLRAIMQGFFSELLDVPNLWVKKSCSSDYYDWEGCGYNDFYEASETNISFLKLNESGDINTNKIIIAGTPICVNKGRTHCDRETIDTTYQSGEYYTCERCGERVHEDDVEWVGDYPYCSASCAEQDGYVWCENIDEWRDEDDCDVYYIDSEYYYDSYGDVITASDGEHFRDSDDAINNGYEYCEDTNEWEYNHFYDDYDECYYHDDSERVNPDDNHSYRNVDNAEADGWRMLEDGIWERAESEVA